MKKLFFAALMLLVFGACSSEKAADAPVPVVVFETDMGNDVDDALALDLLYKAMDDGKINLAAVSCHKQGDCVTDFIDVMNTWYGYPGVEIWRAARCVANDHAPDYTRAVCAMTDEAGQPVFPRRGQRVEDAVKGYRRLLSGLEDGAAVIVSVGFSTTLAALLQSPPDEYSVLAGRDLVARKVKYASVMGGSFGPNARAEYNIVNDIPAARYFFEHWPTPIVLAPFELGVMVQYPWSSIDNDFDWTDAHPMVEAYKSYRPGPYDRASWDLMSVLYVLHPEMFTVSEPGRIGVDEQGYTHFVPEDGGRDAVLCADRAQADSIKSYFLRTLPRKPKNRADAE